MGSLEGCVFDAFEAAPRVATVDDFGLERTIDRLGQSIVLTVANAANQVLDASLSQPFGIFDRQILRATVRMMVSH